MRDGRRSSPEMKGEDGRGREARNTPE